MASGGGHLIGIENGTGTDQAAARGLLETPTGGYRFMMGNPGASAAFGPVNNRLVTEEVSVVSRVRGYRWRAHGRAGLRPSSSSVRIFDENDSACNQVCWGRSGVAGALECCRR